ncbi:HNH endonuclease [Halalkalibacter urbisdiaboli]|uniref:HNH endonuclease n=1 Tax=Halalkalibacter urbisdiaboli TaxID=1960589 RepID=UPI000B435312|nr:HNH endonuclease [Halalkalibacter urbisdiaboli]
MGIIRGIGKVVNVVGGGTAKTGVTLVSKAISKKHEKLGSYLGEVGHSVVDASQGAIDSVTQFADGSIQGAYGVITKDDYHKQQGWGDIKDSTGRTLKGLGSSITYTARNVGTTFNGIIIKDKDQVISGAKNLGKVAAVAGLAIGVVDFVDGPNTAEAETIDTRNGNLTGEIHPETGVPFEEKTIQLPNGDKIDGTFPVFESKFSVILAEEIYLESDRVHFNVANETLYQSIQEDSNIAKELGLSQSDVVGLANGQTPPGYDWHHNEEPGVLQLVDEETHQQTAHTGGRSIWGGGTENR